MGEKKKMLFSHKQTDVSGLQSLDTSNKSTKTRNQ